MTHFHMTQWMHVIMHQERRSAIPIMTHPGIDMISQRVSDAVTDGDTHFRAIQALAEHYPAAASTMIMDLTLEAEAFGCPVTFSESDVPVVTGSVAADRLAVDRLPIPPVLSGRIPEFLKAARLAAEHIHDRPVLGGCIGPFSLAGRLFGLTAILTEAFLDPDTVECLVGKCTAFLRAYVQEMKRAGIHGIIMAEPAAGLLDEDLCDRFSSNPVRQIVEVTQDEHFLFILHNCGNTGHVTRSMIGTGAGGLHMGNRADIAQTLREVPESTLVLGNLDPVGAFRMSSPQGMRQLTLNLLKQAEGHAHFVLSSGCDTPPGVPEANIRAFYEALEEYNTGQHG